MTLGNGLGPSLSASLTSFVGAPKVGMVVLAFNGVALMLLLSVRLRDTQGRDLLPSLT